MSKDNGGPAFPVALNPGEGFDVNRMGPADGMTLRDYFAAKALGGLCADGATAGTKRADLIAECYALADAMIVERSK